MIKSPLRYPGGKSKAITIISKLVPYYDEYREPFLGGGSLFLYLKQINQNKKFWINDIYKPLFAFWEELQNNSEQVINKISQLKKEILDGKDYFNKIKNDINNLDGIDLAVAFFILNRITFSGTTESGGYSEAAFQKRFTISSIERVKYISKLLKNVRITNYDYKNVIRREGENVFIFLDPPYYSATKSAIYGKNGNLHKGFNHKEFANEMRNCNHKWLITYDDCDYIKNLFNFANIFEWDLTYGMRNVNKNTENKGKELFISNYLTNYPSYQQTGIFEQITELRDNFTDEIYHI